MKFLDTSSPDGTALQEEELGVVSPPDIILPGLVHKLTFPGWVPWLVYIQ